MLLYKTAVPSALAPATSRFCRSAPGSFPSSCQISSGSFADIFVKLDRTSPRTSRTLAQSRSVILSMAFTSTNRNSGSFVTGCSPDALSPLYHTIRRIQSSSYHAVLEYRIIGVLDLNASLPYSITPVAQSLTHHSLLVLSRSNHCTPPMIGIKFGSTL